ncbi:MAG TPA: YcaO-like family protein [Actinomycetota bacterium]|nr:YcaO-like family protein [Actinomycetota bacterium]
MTSGADVYCRLARGGACGPAAAGFFAEAGGRFFRWKVDAPAVDRLLWALMLRQGVYVRDLLRWAGRYRGGLRTIVDHGLAEGWLEGERDAPADPALHPAGAALLLGSPSLIPPGVAVSSADAGPAARIEASLSLDASVVVYEGARMRWRGFAALCEVPAAVPVVAHLDLGHEVLVVTLPAGCGACLECALRWYEGSSPNAREVSEWVRSVVAQPLTDVAGPPAAAGVVCLRVSEVLEGTRTRASIDLVRVPDEASEEVPLVRHPSCGGGTSVHGAMAASQGPESLAAAIGRGRIIHGFATEDIGTPAGAPAYHLARAAPNSATRTRTVDPVFCFGDDTDPAVARIRCIAECLERYCIFHYDGARLVRSTRADLPAAVDPRSLPLFPDDRYDDRGFGFAPYVEPAELDWVEGTRLRDGSSAWVPAEAVFLGYEPPGLPLLPASSTGVAVAASTEAAVEGALLEVLERDALALAFLLRMRLPREDLSADEHIAPLVERMQSEGFVVTAFSLRLDVDVPAFLVTAVRVEGDAPRLLRGAAASPDASDALRHAFRETWRSFLYYRSYPRTLPVALEDVSPNSIEYNIAYYQDATCVRELDFLAGGRAGPGDASTQSARSVVERVGERGYEPIHVDCTLPEVASLGFRCARVIVPGMQPLSFGRQPWRLAEERIAAIAGRAVPRDSLNTGTHFFA